MRDRIIGNERTDVDLSKSAHFGYYSRLNVETKCLFLACGGVAQRAKYGRYHILDLRNHTRTVVNKIFD